MDNISSVLEDIRDVLGGIHDVLQSIQESIRLLATTEALEAPAPKLTFPLASYVGFDFGAIGAKVVSEDADGPTVVMWNGKLFKRRVHNDGIKASAVTYTRGVKAGEGGVVYECLVRFVDQAPVRKMPSDLRDKIGAGQVLPPTTEKRPAIPAPASPDATVTPHPTTPPSPTVTPNPTANPSQTVTPTPKANPSQTTTPNPKATPSPTATPTPKATPSPTATPTPKANPTPTAGHSPTATAPHPIVAELMRCASSREVVGMLTQHLRIPNETARQLVQEAWINSGRPHMLSREFTMAVLDVLKQKRLIDAEPPIQEEDVPF